jgi:hypothetical protein
MLTLISSAALSAACATSSGDIAATRPKMTEEEIGKRYAELGTPGVAHRMLDPLIGTFKWTSRLRATPDAPEEVSEGTETNEWILGGRFIRSKSEGTMTGEPFTGIGFTGYDNQSGKYQNVWIDSFSTGIMPAATGTADASGRTITFSRTYVHAITNQPTTTREVVTIEGPDRHVFEWHEPDADGKEFRMMRIEYTRVR